MAVNGNGTILKNGMSDFDEILSKMALASSRDTLPSCTRQHATIELGE